MLIPKYKTLYGIENITNEEIMDKLDMFEARSGKEDEFGWWDMEIIQTDTWTQFTSKEFQESLSIYGVKIALLTPYHQKTNGQVKATWRTLYT